MSLFLKTGSGDLNLMWINLFQRVLSEASLAIVCNFHFEVPQLLCSLAWLAALYLTYLNIFLLTQNISSIKWIEIMTMH